MLYDPFFSPEKPNFVEHVYVTFYMLIRAVKLCIELFALLIRFQFCLKVIASFDVL